MDWLCSLDGHTRNRSETEVLTVNCGLMGCDAMRSCRSVFLKQGSAPPERLRNTVVGNCRFLEHVLTSPLGLMVEISFA
jgi:hypothetical protein